MGQGAESKGAENENENGEVWGREKNLIGYTGQEKN